MKKELKTAKILAEEYLEQNKDKIKMNKWIKIISKSMDTKVPIEMRYIFSVYVATTFINHFRKKIEVHKGNEIPTNGIFLVLAKSGGGKTSNIKRGHKAFELGYALIEQARAQVERELAEAVGENPRRLKPLTNSLSTGPGIIRVINEFADEHIGCPNVQIDELVNAISQSVDDFKSNIQIVSETFDDGDMEAKALKDSERQSDPIKGMGITSMLVGAQNEILRNPKLLDILLIEAETKLHRRMVCCCPIFKEDEEEYFEKYEDVFKAEEEKVNNQIYNRMLMQKQSGAIFSHMIELEKIEIEEKANLLLSAIKSKYAGNKIADEEIHWRVRKIAGVLASLSCKSKITEEDALEALHFIEFFKDDWDRFYAEASAIGHMKVIQYFLKTDEPITAHELKKQKVINKVDDLYEIVKLVNTSETKFRIEVFNNSLRKVKEEKVEMREGVKVHSISYVNTIPVKTVIEGIKSEEVARALSQKSHGKYSTEDLTKGLSKKEAKQLIAATMTVDGYTLVKETFDEIKAVMCHDTAYLPYELENGKRGDHYLKGGTSVVILDIDKGILTDTEAHDLLGDYNHHICRGSDKHNPYKFRVFLESDVLIKLDAEEWLLFMNKVDELLQLEIDMLPRAQFFYGYGDRKVLSNLDGIPFPSSELMQNLSKSIKRTEKVTSIKERTRAYSHRKEIFHKLYEYERGQGLTLRLWETMIHAYNKGLTIEQNEEIIKEALEEIQKRTGKVPRKGYLRSLQKQRERAYARRD